MDPANVIYLLSQEFGCNSNSNVSLVETKMAKSLSQLLKHAVVDNLEIFEEDDEVMLKEEPDPDYDPCDVKPESYADSDGMIRFSGNNYVSTERVFNIYHLTVENLFFR